MCGRNTPPGNEAIYLARYRHNADVREYFQGRNDLLVMDLEAGHGWHELCRFLGGPTPNQPFPHLDHA